MGALPTTRYARTDDGVHLAYQVFGEGPVDILQCGVSWWHLEFQWTEPHWKRFLERLGSLGRVIMFDKRGAGLSDRVPAGQVASIGGHLEDVTTVLDAVGSSSAIFYGSNYGGQLAILYAATFPNRVEGLVVDNAMARVVRAHDYPYGILPDQAERTLERVDAHWDKPVNLHLITPTRFREPEVEEWWLTMQRLSASPGAAVEILRAAYETDIRDVLPAVQCPVLVIHHRGNQLIDGRHSHYLAEHLPRATRLEVDGPDVFFTSRDGVADAIEEFVTGRPAAVRSDRMLATVLFTDLVDSTGHAARVGDSAWSDLLDRHDTVVRRALERHRGRPVNPTGDGILALFDSPSAAVHAACAICDGVAALGLRARAGVHVGEVEARAADVSGIAVHIGARVASLAGAGQVLVTRTVTELAAGAGLDFVDRGDHALKGVPDRWQLFEVRR